MVRGNGGGQCDGPFYPDGSFQLCTIAAAAGVAHEIPAEVNVMHNGVSFLVGLYALLITIPTATDIRRPVFDEYLTAYMYGLRAIPHPPTPKPHAGD